MTRKRVSFVVVVLALCASFIPLGPAGCGAMTVPGYEQYSPWGGDGCGPATLGTLFVWDPLVSEAELTIQTGSAGAALSLLLGLAVYALLTGLRALGRTARSTDGPPP